MSEEQKATLYQMLKARFSYYCSTGGWLSREEQKKLAEKLADDLVRHEWETLKAHLTSWEAQGFYGSKEMWDMIQRAQDRIPDDIMTLYPMPDAIVHALLDTENRIRKTVKV